MATLPTYEQALGRFYTTGKTDWLDALEANKPQSPGVGMGSFVPPDLADPEIAKYVEAQQPKGAILPWSRDAAGNNRLDWSAGLTGTIGRALASPADVMAGRVVLPPLGGDRGYTSGDSPPVTDGSALLPLWMRQQMGPLGRPVRSTPHDQALEPVFDLAGVVMGGGGVGKEAVREGLNILGWQPGKRAAAAAPEPAGPTLGTFGGRLAKGADQEKLIEAMAMKRAGEPRETIWDKTGWFEGVDGKWRFEIPDNRSYITKPLRSSEGAVAGPMSTEMAHKQLYANYPEMADVPMVVRDAERMGGRHFPAGQMGADDMGLIEARAPSLADARNVALHEAQHRVQNIEGFASGGNTEIPIVKRAAREEVDTNRSVAEQRLEEIQAHRKNWVDQRVAEGMPFMAAVKQYDSTFPAVRGEMNELIGVLETPGFVNAQGRAYRRLAGEVEARNVQTRRDFTPEERRARPPWTTEDVPQSRQIVIDDFGNEVKLSGVGAGYMDMLDPARMELGKELANQRRGQGLPTGKDAPGWNFKRPDAEPGSPERLAAEAAARARPIVPSPDSPLMTPDDYAALGGRSTADIDQSLVRSFEEPQAVPVTNPDAALRSMLDVYHGSPRADLDVLRPSERGPFGPATYFSPHDGIAGRYRGPDGRLYSAQVPDDEIFHGLGSYGRGSDFNPSAVWRAQGKRLVDAAEPDKKQAVEALVGKMWASDGYPFYARLAQLYGGDAGAQGLLQKAGFRGISGHVDGPEIAYFGEVTPRRDVTLGSGSTDGTGQARTAAALGAKEALSNEQAAATAAAREADATALGGPAYRDMGPGSGGRSGSRSVEEAQASAARVAAGARAIEGLPQKPLRIGGEGGDWYVPGPIKSIRDVADSYMASRGGTYTPPDRYVPVDPARASRIAQAFDEMKHAPDDPRVRASYDAMIDETIAQYRAMENSGLKIEFIKPGQPDPYALSPRQAAIDVADNNHLWVFPTESGYGQVGMEAAAANNPMLRPTGIEIGGHKLLANDVFRIVHDYFGHLKEGHGFRAAGEDNAWRTHAAMYSDLARGAMTSETRGQNSWVNYGPNGAKNRTASSADTVYAEQKVGLLPDWVWDDLGAGAKPKKPEHAPPVRGEMEVLYPNIVNVGEVEVLKNPSVSELRRLVRDITSEDDMHSVRVMRDPKGNVYAWDGYDSTHDYMAIKLGMKSPSIDDVANLVFKNGRLVDMDRSGESSFLKWFMPKRGNVTLGSGSRDRRGDVIGAVSATGKGYQDALWHDVSKIKLPKPVSEMESVVKQTSNNPDRTISPSALQGGRLVPVQGDRTRSGGQLWGVNGYKFDDPVSLEGGPSFMRDNMAAWASSGPVAQQVQNKVMAAGLKGDDVYGVTVSMGGRSGDYAHMNAGAMARMIEQAPITNAAKQLFDQEMVKKGVTDWPGVGSPDLKRYLDRRDKGEVRKAFMQLVDTSRYQKMGFPSAAEARVATTDPRILNEPTGASGLAIARMDPRGEITPSRHTTYSHDIPGTYMGGLAATVPKEVMFPKISAAVDQYLAGIKGYKPTSDYLFGRLPKGLPKTELADQQWVDTVSKHLEDRGFKLGSGDTSGTGQARTAALLGSTSDQRGLTAYHGSPHDFDRFDMSKIGTGEGEQVFGHGLYFAGAEKTAQHYRDILSKNAKNGVPALTFDGKRLDTAWPAMARQRWSDRLEAMPDTDRKALVNILTDLSDAKTKSMADQLMKEAPANEQRLYKELIRPNLGKSRLGGRMYEVNLDVDPEMMLQFEKPYSQQPEFVQRVMRDEVMRHAQEQKQHAERLLKKYPQGNLTTFTGTPITNPLLRARAKADLEKWQETVKKEVEEIAAGKTGKQLYTQAGLPAISPEDGYPKSTAALLAKGIPGLRYLDAMSRPLIEDGPKGYTVTMGEKSYGPFKTVEKATAEADKRASHNYVIFDDRLIRILRKYGIAVPGAAAAAGAAGGGFGALAPEEM